LPLNVRRGLNTHHRDSSLACELLCPATLGTESDDAVKVLRNLEVMLGSEFFLKFLKLLGIEFDNAATLRTDHVIVVLMFVIVLVVCDAIAEPHLARK